MNDKDIDQAIRLCVGIPPVRHGKLSSWQRPHLRITLR